MKRTFTERCGLSQIQIIIARLYAAVPCDAAEVKKVFLGLHFNELSSEESLLLAQAAARNEYAGVPPKFLPRLRGVLAYHAAKNAAVMSETAKLIGYIRAEGIDVLLCKGAAIKCCYGQNRIRHMWDADFSIKKSDFKRALEIARENGYTGLAARHSIDLRGKNGNLADIHKIFMRELLISGDDAVWMRALPADFYGQTVFVPCREDLIIQLMANAALDFAQQPIPFKWIADMVNLLPEADSEKLVKHARELGVSAQVGCSFEILSGVLPDLCDYEKLISGMKEKDDHVILGRLAKLACSYPVYQTDYQKKGMRYITASLRAKWDEHCYLCGKRLFLYRLFAFPAFLKNCTGGEGLIKSFFARLRRHREAVR